MGRLTEPQSDLLILIAGAGCAGLPAIPGTPLYDAAAGDLSLMGLIAHRAEPDGYRLYLSDAGRAEAGALLQVARRRASFAVVRPEGSAGRAALADTDQGQGRDA